jgi:2-isopropylmalate synthase
MSSKDEKLRTLASLEKAGRRCDRSRFWLLSPGDADAIKAIAETHPETTDCCWRANERDIHAAGGAITPVACGNGAARYPPLYTSPIHGKAADAAGGWKPRSKVKLGAGIHRRC